MTDFTSYTNDNPLSANPTECSNTLKQFVSCWWRIVWVCLIILWGWCLRGQHSIYIWKLYKEALSKLEIASEKLFQWFSDNQLKANLDNCHLLCSADVKVSLNISNEKIRSLKCMKLLGVNIDYGLTFDTHINEVRINLRHKLNALSRMIVSMDFS